MRTEVMSQRVGAERTNRKDALATIARIGEINAEAQHIDQDLDC